MPENNFETDTIAAVATPPGKGGVGIVRVSGPNVSNIANTILGIVPNPRHAFFTNFCAADDSVIDEGIAIYFPAPNSFTGEDVIELQGHGGPVVMDRLLQSVLMCGARLANPGEFSQRAFLNGRIDLTQAEAIADLIDAASTQASRSAIRSLQGAFSAKINHIFDLLTNLRVNIEAAIDFTEEEIPVINKLAIGQKLTIILDELEQVQQNATQGRLLREGIKVVIAGKPNVGKSSLLNYFTGHDSAIVTDIPGTTRDVLREYININGLPVHIIDTAGLRDSADVIEQEGIKRAHKEIADADYVLLLVDDDNIDFNAYADIKDKLIIVRNKIDLTKQEPQVLQKQDYTMIYVSVKTAAGLDLLKQYLVKQTGYEINNEGIFMARQRHLQALEQTAKSLSQAQQNITKDLTLDIIAEDLRQAQNQLGEITGAFYTEDLLDKIFAGFCVGK